MTEKLYTPLSDVKDGLRVITFYAPMVETLSVDLKEAVEFPLLDTAEKCGELCARMAIMDEAFWPPVNPIPGRVKDGRLVALVALDPINDEGAEHIFNLAERVGLDYEDIREREGI